MIDENPMRAVCEYGSSAAYKDPPTEEQIRSGVVPLDSLPAAWWNWLWNETNSSVNEARSALTSVITELNNVLCCAGITPQSACMDQLYKAIVCLRQAAATESTAGSVKSSSVCGKVSVAADGTMTANGLGNASSLSTSVKTSVVAAINELKSTYDSCFTDVNGSLSTLENSKLDATGCAADSSKLGGTTKSGLLTGVTFTNGCVGVTVGGTTCSVALGSAAACSTTAFLAANGCAADSAKLGGTAKSGLLTAFSCANNQLSLTVGGTTCTAPLTVPGACFGTAQAYYAYKCAATGEAAAAECRVELGCARSYRWCQCPTNTCSYDRRTFTAIGTYQAQNSCAGMTYLDTCVWQCCYSGTAGVVSCTNRRWCFCSSGRLYSPAGVTSNNGSVIGQSSTFGDMLVAYRTGSANYASVTFCNCNGVLGHIGTNTKDGRLVRVSSDGGTTHTIYDDTSTDIPARYIMDHTCCDPTASRVYVGYSGTSLTSSNTSHLAAYSTTLCDGQVVIKDLPKGEAQAFLGLGTAAYCSANSFRSSAWTPSYVSCAGWATTACCACCNTGNTEGYARCMYYNWVESDYGKYGVVTYTTSSSQSGSCVIFCNRTGVAALVISGCHYMQGGDACVFVLANGASHTAYGSAWTTYVQCTMYFRLY